MNKRARAARAPARAITTQSSTAIIILVDLEILDKYPALVLHYSGVLLLLRFPRILTGESYYSTS
jgi:hypothetical protein